MRSRQEVIAFETALAELAKHPQTEDLPTLHLIFDDRCEQPEVMFSLLHYFIRQLLEDSATRHLTDLNSPGELMKQV